jgi:hypothetical protein
VVCLACLPIKLLHAFFPRISATCPAHSITRIIFCEEYKLRLQTHTHTHSEYVTVIRTLSVLCSYMFSPPHPRTFHGPKTRHQTASFQTYPKFPTHCSPSGLNIFLEILQYVRFPESKRTSVVVKPMSTFTASGKRSEISTLILQSQCI